jgi:hypothetical protein
MSISFNPPLAPGCTVACNFTYTGTYNLGSYDHAIVQVQLQFQIRGQPNPYSTQATGQLPNTAGPHPWTLQSTDPTLAQQVTVTATLLIGGAAQPNPASVSGLTIAAAGTPTSCPSRRWGWLGRLLGSKKS